MYTLKARARKAANSFFRYSWVLKISMRTCDHLVNPVIHVAPDMENLHQSLASRRLCIETSGARNRLYDLGAVIQLLKFIDSEHPSRLGAEFGRAKGANGGSEMFGSGVGVGKIWEDDPGLHLFGVISVCVCKVLLYMCLKDA